VGILGKGGGTVAAEELPKRGSRDSRLILNQEGCGEKAKSTTVAKIDKEGKNKKTDVRIKRLLTELVTIQEVRNIRKPEDQPSWEAWGDK